MTLDDLKRIFLGPTLFRLDTILSPRLVPVLYSVGLASILLWAVTHLFATFGSNFGNGLWGLLEIIVFGALGLVILRIACEALLVFFETHREATENVSRTRISSTLLDEVRDAIHDIADDEDDYISPATDVPPSTPRPVDITPKAPARPAVRRTARRTPAPKS